MNIETKKFIYGLLSAAILAAAGAFVDVQLLKAEVKDQNQKIEDIYKNTIWLKERWIEKFGRK